MLLGMTLNCIQLLPAPLGGCRYPSLDKAKGLLQERASGVKPLLQTKNESGRFIVSRHG